MRLFDFIFGLKDPQYPFILTLFSPDDLFAASYAISHLDVLHIIIIIKTYVDTIGLHV